MRHSTIHVWPLVALLSVAFCAGAALAANYTLTNQSVEWPFSLNEADNSSNNKYTIVGDVTVTFTNVTSATTDPGVRPKIVVSDGATLTLDLTQIASGTVRIFSCMEAYGSGKVRVKGDPDRVVFSNGSFSVLPPYVFDAPDFAFIDENGDVRAGALTFDACAAVRRWPNCGYSFRGASLGLIGDGDVMLAPDAGTDTITLATGGIKNLILVNDTALDASTRVEVPKGCTLYLKPASYSTNTLAWTGEERKTNSTDVVLAGGKLSLQAMPNHYVLGDITGTGTVAMEVTRSRGNSMEYTWLLGNNSFEGSVSVARGTTETSPDRLSFGTSPVPGHATNKVTLAKWSELAFFAPDGSFAPEVTIGSLQGAEATSVLRVQAGQTITINAFTGTFYKRGAGEVVFGPGVGDVSSWTQDDGTVYVKGTLPDEVSVESIVNIATGTNTLALGGAPLFTGASSSYVVQAAAGERARVLADDTVPVVAGGEGTVVLESRDWRERAALWIDPSVTDPGPFGTCAKDEWWGTVITSNLENQYKTQNKVSGNGYFIEYMPDCREGHTGYFLRNTRNYNYATLNTNPYCEYIPNVYAYQKPNGCNGLTTICCAGASRRLQIASGVVKSTSVTTIPANMVVMVFGSQDGGGHALVGTGTGAFKRAGNTVNHGLTTNNTASIWLDGVKVSDPTTQKFNGGWQVVSIDTSGNNVNAFGWAKDYNDAGGQNYGEILVFTNVLSDAERTTVESYLAAKWGISTYQGSVVPSVARAVGRTGTLEVASGSTVTLGGCYAGTVDVKAGATLTVADEQLPPTPDELPASGRVGWFDPDADGALYQPNSSGTRAEEVQSVFQRGKTLSDIAENDVFLWAPGSRRPFRVVGARGWGPVRAWIDCQEIDVSSPTVDTGNCLRPRQYPNTDPTVGDGGSNMTIPCRTVFMASDSFRGGGSPVLGGVSGGNGIAVRDHDDYHAPIWAGGTHARITGGETRLNGVRVASPTSTGFTGAPEVFSFTTTADQNIGCFGNLYNTQKGVNFGEVFGEILLYNVELTGADRLKVEAYLMGKWCGTLPEGYSDLREATVTGGGTLVAPAGKMPRLDTAFAGTARVTGSEAAFDVVIDPVAGTVTGALVAPNATLELPASATVNVTFTSKPIHGGAWTLVDVGTMATANLEWTVNASVTGMSVVKSVSPARVAIEVLPAGTTIIFR